MALHSLCIKVVVFVALNPALSLSATTGIHALGDNSVTPTDMGDPAQLRETSTFENQASAALARAQLLIAAASRAGHGSDVAEQRRLKEQLKAETLLAMSELGRAFEHLENEGVDSVPRSHPTLPASVSDKPLRIAHIISLLPWESSETKAVLESMQRAKVVAEEFPKRLQVSLHAVQVEGEQAVFLPPSFMLAPPLRESTATRLGCKKPIPFAGSLVETLRQVAPDADLYVLTNSDVGLMPNFYLHVARKFLLHGLDGLSILKVLIPTQCGGRNVADDLHMAYNLTDQLPQTHPGSETFVWPAAVTDDIIRRIGHVFLGHVPYGSAMLRAVRSSTPNFTIVQGEHWTFHIGAEGEAGRGDPGCMSSYEAQVQADLPRCTFRKPDTGKPPSEPDISCDYESLNIKAFQNAVHDAERSAAPVGGNSAAALANPKPGQPDPA